MGMFSWVRFLWVRFMGSFLAFFYGHVFMGTFPAWDHRWHPRAKLDWTS